jgi:hypothetical protein
MNIVGEIQCDNQEASLGKATGKVEAFWQGGNVLI